MWRKPSGSKDRIINKLLLDPHMASTLRFEPGPHWWEATALTTALLFFSGYEIRRYFSGCRDG